MHRELTKLSFNIEIVAIDYGQDIGFRFLEADGCVKRYKSSGIDDVNITICDINANILEVG